MLVGDAVDLPSAAGLERRGCAVFALEGTSKREAPHGTYHWQRNKNKLIGTNAADTIRGLGGNDILIGGGGNDRIEGGAGNDKMDGEAGKDTLFGNTGNDTMKRRHAGRPGYLAAPATTR